MTNHVVLAVLLAGLFCGWNANAEEDMAAQSTLLGTKAVTQIGIVVKDIEKTSLAFAQLMGMEVPQVSITDAVEQAHTLYQGQSTAARAKLAFFRLENITIEFIEPVDKPSTWQEFLDTHGEGVHHIAFEIKGSDEKIQALGAIGMPMIQKGDYQGGRYSYVDSAGPLGVILELLENY